jgi:hypothetical protein
VSHHDGIQQCHQLCAPPTMKTAAMITDHAKTEASYIHEIYLHTYRYTYIMYISQQFPLSCPSPAIFLNQQTHHLLYQLNECT